MKPETLKLKLPVGAGEALRRAAKGGVEAWAIDTLLRAAKFRGNNTGIPGISDSAPTRLAFRLNWSEGGAKKSTTVSYTVETRAAKLAEAIELLKSKRGW